MNNYRNLIKNYFDKHSLVESNIESYNHFIERRIQEIVNETQEIIPTIIPAEVKDFKIKLGKITIEKPQIIEADGSRRDVYPMEARLRKLTYSAPVYLNVSAYMDGVEREQFTSLIGKIPVMVKSKYCHLHGLNKENLIEHNEDPYDLGGYFILNGNERVLIIVEDLVSNKLFVEKSSTGPSRYVAKVYSERGAYRIPHTIEQMKDGVIYLTFTRFKRVPIMAIIKALGLVKDQDINFVISEEKQYDDIFINLYETIDLKTQDQTLDYLSKRIGLSQNKDYQKSEKITDLIDKYLLPHLGISPEDRMAKAYNLCKYVKRFLMIVREGKQLVDKDHYMNKRLKLSGDLLADLFRVNLRALVQDILYNFQRLVKRGKFQSIKIIIRDQLLTSRIKSAMATGAWVGGRKGVSQNIDRTNFISTFSHLQRVVSLLSTTQENFNARALHSTHWGRLCLKKDTNVLLADKYSSRTLEMLQNCWNHHKVTTFDIKNNNLKPSSISKYYTLNPVLIGKKVYKLISESGREIVATEDHPFYNGNKWVNASDLSIGDLVAVYPSLEPVELPKLPTDELGIIIVNEEDIKRDSPNRFKSYIKELKSRELLPFTSNNYKIEIIARLLGHLFSDGHCGKNNLEFYCGSREDAEAIANDIRLLGFNPSKIMEKHTRIIKEGRQVNYRTFVLTKGGALHSLLINAGAPIGRKTDTEVNIPRWIFKSSLSVKREFLGALMGGDGPKPRFSIRRDRKSGSKIHIDDFILHKRLNLKGNIVDFSNDLKKLFNEFNVNIKRISIKEAYKRKDGSLMLKCKLVFAKSSNNVKGLLTEIGYRYCIQKEKEARYIGEWLRLRDFMVNQRANLKKKATQLYRKGFTPKEISNELKLSYRIVNGWLFESYRCKNTRLSQNLLLPYEKWLDSSKLGESGALLEKIIDKRIENLNDVRDFTTTENTHSFIANGFITHNCPVETPEGTPIGLRKNLALLTKISQEDIAEDKVKKLLEGCGVQNG